MESLENHITKYTFNYLNFSSDSFFLLVKLIFYFSLLFIKEKASELITNRNCKRKDSSPSVHLPSFWHNPVRHFQGEHKTFQTLRNSSIFKERRMMITHSGPYEFKEQLKAAPSTNWIYQRLFKAVPTKFTLILTPNSPLYVFILCLESLP